MKHIENESLRDAIIRKTQWPYGKRDVQYQSVDQTLPGIRDMEHRYKIMDFPETLEGETVLDIGCNIGMICIDAKRRGAKRVVGIDYRPETIEVAKKLAEELELEVEFYTYNVNDGLDVLKSLIGEEKFDHVFALSIWGHVDKPTLASLINNYAKTLCWFEGHCVIWSNDTKNAMEVEFEKLLSFDYYEFLGETNDRSARQNYKLSHSYRVIMDERNKQVYFNGDIYKTIRGTYVEDNHGDLSYPKDVEYYSYKGKFCNYIAKKGDKYGYKIFIQDPTHGTSNHEEKKSRVEKIFKIQNILHEEGFAPKAYEIITCHDNQTFYYGIKTDNICGKFINTTDLWEEDFQKVCKKYGITRGNEKKEEENPTHFDFKPNNCIDLNGKVYMVDIDVRWNIL